MDNYSPEQIADIREREADALAYLKKLHLTPAAQISKVHMGQDVFADKLTPYLQDTKYTEVKSPIQHDDLEKN